MEASVSGLISDYQRLKKENADLKKELDVLRAEKEALEALEKETAFRLTALDETIQSVKENV